MTMTTPDDELREMCESAIERERAQNERRATTQDEHEAAQIARALLSRLTQPQAGWRPIETAPRDGTRILLGTVATEPTYDDDGTPSISTIGNWEDAEDDGPDSMGHDAGFIDIDFGEYDWGRSIGNPKYFREARQPTHWQPLPAAPVKEGG